MAGSQNIIQTNQLNPVKFSQLNLQKAKVATDNLADVMVQWSNSPLCILVQEPWVNFNSKWISGFPAGTQIFATEDPRACILATSDLFIHAMDDFTTRDMAVGRWSTQCEECPSVVIVSLYADITENAISNDLVKLMDYCVLNDLPVLMGADTNAHSSLWGCELDNARGETFENFIRDRDLSICNVGAKPTFQTVRAKSIIDVTLVHFFFIEAHK